MKDQVLGVVGWTQGVERGFGRGFLVEVGVRAFLRATSAADGRRVWVKVLVCLGSGGGNVGFGSAIVIKYEVKLVLKAKRGVE